MIYSPRIFSRKTIVLTILIVAIASLGVILYLNKIQYPFGWDVGFYTLQENKFAMGILDNQRIVYPALAVTVHKVTHLTLLQTNLLLPLTLMIALAFICSLIVNRIVPHRATIPISFFTILFSAQYLHLSISLFDNLTALTILALVIYQISDLNILHSKARMITVAGLIAALSITHFETFAFTLLLIIIWFILLTAFQYRKVWISIKKYWYLYLGILGVIVVAFLFWGPAAKLIIQGYTNAPGNGDVSVHYADTAQSIGGYLSFLGKFTQSYLNITFTGVLSIIGVLALLQRRKRNKNNSDLPLLAWIVAAYLLLILAIVRRAIPIDRATLFVPIALIVATGLSAVMVYIRRFFVLRILLLIAIFVIYLSVYIQAIDRQKPTLTKDTFQDLNDVKISVLSLSKQDQQRIVFLTNTPADEMAGSAYYGLWKYWLDATMIETTSKQSCVYFGTYESYRNRSFSSPRDGNPDYNGWNKNSADCIRLLPPNHITIVLKAFIDPPTYSRILTESNMKKISERILVFGI